MVPSPYPFGLSNATAAYASAHVEPSGRHQRFALDLIATTPTHTHADSSEEDEAWARADFSELCDPEAMHRFMVSDQTKEQQPEVAQSTFADATARGKAIVIAETANSRPALLPEQEAEEDEVGEVLGHP